MAKFSKDDLDLKNSAHIPPRNPDYYTNDDPPRNPPDSKVIIGHHPRHTPVNTNIDAKLQILKMQIEQDILNWFNELIVDGGEIAPK